MNNKSSKREMFRGLLKEPGHALRHLFRTPSPTPPTSVQPQDAASAALKTSLEAFRMSSSLIPTLKSFADILLYCVHTIPTGAKNHKDFEEIISSIAASVRILERHLCEVNSTQMTKAIENVIIQLNRQVGYIKDKQQRTRIKSYIEAEKDMDDLIQCYRQIEELFRQLQSDAAMHVWRITNENLYNTRLQGLDPAKSARYDSIAGSQLRRGGCAPNTRRLVLKGLQDWASNPNGARIYWMNGMAGTGKTTIAHSFCSALKDSRRLAASFFCSRSLPECRDVTRIVPTIAYQFARFSAPFQESLCRILGEDPDIVACKIDTQFEKLVRGPLLELQDSGPFDNQVVIIDALDECSGDVESSSVLEALLLFAKDLPIKFFVTCRPERNLLEPVKSFGEASRSLYHLHDIEESLVQADIKTYLQFELGSMNMTATHIDRLTEQSGRLFIYAATAVRYIRAKHASIDSQKRLDIVIGIGSETNTSKMYEPLDALYTGILSAVLESGELEDWEHGNIEMLLRTVVCAREPLSIEGLAFLLRLESVEHARGVIESLQSVLHVDERSGLVSALHASFSDYIFSNTRSRRFFCEEAGHNQLLAGRCFETMSNSLRFNMCNLESSFVLDNDVHDIKSRINNSIPSHLYYACRYWSAHLIRAGEANTFSATLQQFFCQQLLFWIEVMNLKQVTRDGLRMLSEAANWIKRNSLPDDLYTTCQDSQKFITIVGANPVCKSTPHIYVSVLALWDKVDPIWVYYGSRTRNFVQLTGTAVANRESAMLAVWRYRCEIFAASVSYDGHLVASGHSDGTICVWDTHTGNIVIGPLKAHAEGVTSIAFSPDGIRIMSGSFGDTVKVWSVDNGQLVAGPFEGDVVSARFSPNGSCVAISDLDGTIYVRDAYTGQKVAIMSNDEFMFTIAYSANGKCIAAGSGDGIIRIWDIDSQSQITAALTGHTDAVLSVTYSPDGTRIASGSRDRTVRIWDSLTGNPLGTPFEGHTSIIRSVAYSSNGSRILSVSDDYTIRVWDAHSGHTVAGPLGGHTSAICWGTFMPDDNRIVTCSIDSTIRVWDTRIRPFQFNLSEGHTSLILSATFSADGSQIVSSSEEGVIFTWDTLTGAKKAGPFKGHISDVFSVSFSSSGDCFASASGDYTVRLWATRTGSALASPFIGHTAGVNSVSFSPDNRHVASGSSDGTIRVWDVQTGVTTVGPLTGHAGGVNSVSYSPDGGRIISGSSDCTILVWDVQAGVRLASPFEGHTDEIMSVAYSPDGRYIISGSQDCTVRKWDAETGKAILAPLSAHSDHVISVAYSLDGCYIASGSRDHTIYVWEPKAGQVLAGPFRAHTHWVQSVAFSPDSRLIASSSGDRAIRVWDLRMCLSHTSQRPDYWTVNEDGWVVGHDSSLLFWVPPDVRTILKWPQNVTLIHQRGYLELDFTGALIGPRWAECFKPE